MTKNIKKKAKKKIQKKIIALISAIAIFVGQYVYWNYLIPEPSEPQRQVVLLDKCVDGDTAWFLVEGDRVKSRFLYIDTPESTNKVEKKGKEASEFVQEQLENAKTIEVEFNEDGDQYDKYDRALHWVFVDGELLQEKIAEAGYVKKYYDYGYDYKYKDIIIEADKKAQQNKVGLYE